MYLKLVVLLAGIWSIKIAVAELDLNNPIAREIVVRSKGADIKAWMDLSEDPCRDFYNYACSGWHRINSASLANVYTTDQFQEMSKGLQRKIVKLLTHNRTGDLIEDKVRDFYDSCRHVKNNRDDYKIALQAIYKEYGQFSFRKEENDEASYQVDNNWWWTTVAKIYRTYGKSIIFSLVAEADVKNKTQTMLYLSPPEFFLIQAELGKKIPKFLTQYLDVPNAIAHQVAKDLNGFELLLMQGATDIRSGLTVDEMLTLYNTSDLIEKYKASLDLGLYLQLALNSTQLPKQIYVYDEPYLAHLPAVMNITKSQTVNDYILWLLLEGYIVDAQDKSWNEWCSEKSKKYFGKFIDYAIYKQYRSEAFENEIFKIWHEIKSAFRDNLRGNKYQWLSPKVRDHAIRKLEHMRLSINSYSKENFEKFFGNLSIQPNAYVRNIQNILKQMEHLKSDKLQHKSEDMDETQVLSFTPVYNTFENEIKIPVALLQPFRVWHPLYPNATKYATLGFLLAHEMIHGFDDEGRQYDADGHTLNWWDEASVDEFNARRRCFQDQYHNYTYYGKVLPSSVTQSENIADNAGVQLAYQAYARWLQTAEAEGHKDVTTGESFKNLSFKNWEIFFLSFAQLWCDDVHKDYTTLALLRDVHAPAMFRVIGTLSNFDKFSTTFKCRPGSVMNPIKKCAIY